nr:YccF domain-containing protein [uncultured Campylobacter sp.]
MRILGNIIWFFMAGWILAILTYLSGLILTVLVVTAPVGLGLMEYGKFLFLPFTHDMVRKKKGSITDAVHMTYQTYANIVKVIYIIVFGIWLFIGGIFTVIGQFITIIGIPCAIVLAKSLGTIFNPVDKVCISHDLAEELRRRVAAAKADEISGVQQSAAAESLQNCEYDVMPQKLSVVTIVATVCSVVLVLLAVAVVLPRVNLSATREDAEISKLVTNLTTVKFDIEGYYISQGKFPSDLSTATNVRLISNGANSAYLMGANIYKCFVISVDDKKKTITIEKGPDAENKICKGAYEYSTSADMLSKSPISVKSY